MHFLGERATPVPAKERPEFAVGSTGLERVQLAKVLVFSGQRRPNRKVEVA